MRCLLVSFGMVWLLAVAGMPAWGGEDEPLLALADEPLSSYFGDEQFVSIATGGSKPVSRAPAVATLITARDIEEMGARTLMEALESVPGLHVSLSSINRLNPLVSIRGIHTGQNPQVLFLMNGHRFEYVYGARLPELFRYPVQNVERIEILRGPGSALYGADAFSGVVNIVTKRGRDMDGVAVGARSGSFDSDGAWLQAGKEGREWEASFSFEWMQTDGDDDRVVHSDFQTILDQIDGTNASLAPGPLATRTEELNTHLDLRYQGIEFRLWNWRLIDAGCGAGALQALDPVGRNDADLYLVDLAYRNEDLLRDWVLSAELNYKYYDAETHFVILPPGSKGFPDGMLGQPGVLDRGIGGTLKGVYTGWTRHSVSLGVGRYHVSEEARSKKNHGPGAIDGQLTDVTGTPYNFIPDSERDTWFAYLQDEWKLAADWELTAGLRYDHYSDFGSTLNPRLALVWDARHNLTTKLLYGRAFRAPSVSELYTDQNPVMRGNQGLDPEYIDTFELVFDSHPTFDLQLVVSLFYDRIDGLVAYLPDAGATTATAQNAVDQDGYGGELEINWDATDDLRLFGNYAYQHATDRKTGDFVPDAARQQLYLGAHYTFLGNGSVHPTVNWVMDRPRSEGDSRPEIDDYVLIDLTLRWKNLFLRNLDLALAGRNLFHEDAREPSTARIPDDYPLEGRSFWGEVRYRF